MSSRNSTRRDFLRTSGSILAAGTAIPYFWSSAYAKEESKNDKLVVAAIGVGGRGTAIGHQAAELGDMVACCDVHRGNAEKFAEAVKKKGGQVQGLRGLPRTARPGKGRSTP